MAISDQELFTIDSFFTILSYKYGMLASLSLRNSRVEVSSDHRERRLVIELIVMS